MATSGVPKLSRKLIEVSISQRFREAVQIQTVDTSTPGSGELLVRSRYVGINASDINWTAGRYAPYLQLHGWRDWEKWYRQEGTVEDLNQEMLSVTCMEVSFIVCVCVCKYHMKCGSRGGCEFVYA